MQQKPPPYWICCSSHKLQKKKENNRYVIIQLKSIIRASTPLAQKIQLLLWIDSVPHQHHHHHYSLLLLLLLLLNCYFAIEKIDIFFFSCLLNFHFALLLIICRLAFEAVASDFFFININLNFFLFFSILFIVVHGIKKITIKNIFWTLPDTDWTIRGWTKCASCAECRS